MNVEIFVCACMLFVAAALIIVQYRMIQSMCDFFDATRRWYYIELCESIGEEAAKKIIQHWPDWSAFR